MKKVFYITGRGGDYQLGLGEYLAALPIDLDGISLSEAFLGEEFDLQIETLISKLNQFHPTHIIANSYGAYLFLHSQLPFESIHNSVLLLSPVLGKCITKNRYVRPPRASELNKIIESGLYPKFKHLEVHVGKDDPGGYELAISVSAYISANKCNVIENEGHNINHGLVRSIVTEFLNA